jgi:CRISPR type III-A-associated protein Csm2
MVDAKKEALCCRRKEDREEIRKLKERINSVVDDFMEGRNRSQILLNLIKEIAEGVSREAITCKLKRDGSVGQVSKLSFTKVRKYYEQFLNVYEEYIQEEVPSDNLLLKLYMIKSYLAYDRARKKINSSFEEFLSSIVLKIKDKKTLEAGKILFEAFVGYARGFLENEGGKDEKTKGHF